MRKNHAGVGLCEVSDLLPPRQVVAAQAVREDDRRPAAGDFVIDAAIGTLEETSACLESEDWVSMSP